VSGVAIDWAALFTSTSWRRDQLSEPYRLAAAGDRYLRFYNIERPHRGYRLQGLTPVTKFAGAVAA
jgi:hypothetical protein